MLSAPTYRSEKGMVLKSSVLAVFVVASIAWFALDVAENTNTCNQQIVQKINAKMLNRADQQDFLDSRECAKMIATGKVVQAIGQSAR